MSGLGWPGRGRRGAHGGGAGLGWPGRRAASGAGAAAEPEDAPDLGSVAREDDPAVAAPSPESAAPVGDAGAGLPAVLPEALRTGPEAPVAPVVVTAPVERVGIADPVPLAAREPAVATAPVDPDLAEAAPAEPAPVDTAPVDTAPVDTAPVDTAPVDTAPPVPPTAPDATAPAAEGPPDESPADAGPADAGRADDASPDPVAPEAAVPVVVEPSEQDAPRDVLPPVERIRAVLRDEEPPPPDPDEDLPIGKQAAAAARALNPGGRHDFPRPRRRRIITVANQKGGVGKTTSTVNLAAAMALHGLKVLVIDLDPQGNASTGLGVPHHSGTPSVYDVLIEQVPIAEVVQPADGVANLSCVPATIDLAGAEIELVSVVARESRLQRAIAAYCDGPGADLDVVLVDCPPSLGLLTVNAMVATEELLIPIQCEYYALEGLGQLLKNVELVRKHLNPALHVSTILLTMYDARTKLADQVAEEVRKHFGDTVLATSIPRSVRVSEAPGYGQSVVTYDPGSRGALAYLEAAREIAVRGADPAVEPGAVQP